MYSLYLSYFRVELPSDEVPVNNEMIQRYHYLFKRFSGQISRIDMNLLTSILLSSRSREDLLSVNPYIEQVLSIFFLMLSEQVDAVLAKMPEILLRSTRISHANRTIAAAQDLKNLLLHIQSHTSKATSNVLLNKLQVKFLSN